jgi:enoyl-CoA hydratase/carnithine racemase
MVEVFTGTGRAFCAGEDMKESSSANGRRALRRRRSVHGRHTPPAGDRNGFAMGGGFQSSAQIYVSRCRPRSSGLGGEAGCSAATIAWWPVCTPIATGWRSASASRGRLYQVGFLNRLAPSPDRLLPVAFEMAEHLLTLPPASRVNTVYMMRQMRPRVAPSLENLAARLHEHGAKDDLMESRRAFAEKRPPRFKGWNDPADRHRLPTLEGPV